MANPARPVPANPQIAPRVIPPIRGLPDGLDEKVNRVVQLGNLLTSQLRIERSLRIKTITSLSVGALTLVTYALMLNPPAVLAGAGVVSIVAGVHFARKYVAHDITAKNDLPPALIEVLKFARGKVPDEYPAVQNLFRQQAQRFSVLNLKWENGFEDFSAEDVRELVATLSTYFTSLTDLSLEGFSFLNSVSLRPLAGLRHLKNLDLSKTDIDDAAMDNVRYIQSLRGLTMKWCHSLTVDAFDRLGNPNRNNATPPLVLQALDISGTRLVPLPCDVQTLLDLREEMINRADDKEAMKKEISDNFDKGIDDIHTRIHHKAHEITENHLAFLQYFGRLTHLTISHISDTALTSITQRCPLLESLTIPYSLALKGNTLEGLGNLRHLTFLGIDRCPDLTFEAFEKIISVRSISAIQFIKPLETFVKDPVLLKKIRDLLINHFEPFPRPARRALRANLEVKDIKDIWVRHLPYNSDF